MSTSGVGTVVRQARDLLRWCSPLRTELWASRLAAGLEPDEVEPFLRELRENGGTEARLALAALAAVHPERGAAPTGPQPGAPAVSGQGVEGEGEGEAGLARRAEEAYAAAGEEVAGTLPGWVRRMGRVVCEGGWYGPADPFGEQALAALSFRYENGKEPHLLVVAVDQPNGGLAVDAVVEEVKFLDDLGLEPADPGVVAGRVLDAFELGERVLGAVTAGTLDAVRAVALARARSVPGLVRGAADDAVAAFRDLPDVPGAAEAFGRLAEFVGDRPLWWSPARVSRFLTSWLPREAVLSDEAVAAMPDVVRAWSRCRGGHPAVLRQVDADAPLLPALMADDSLAGVRKRMTRNQPPDHP
ncbi:hypothetical protein [Nonomuraea pusilla]|uniref:hypothetical protein n=1 Tax=Nonomuraea pusilla TaxID=46177 RepID=UPI00116012B5|nr:hypothetical protein [Nonomuraea pusilla]